VCGKDDGSAKHAPEIPHLCRCGHLVFRAGAHFYIRSFAGRLWWPHQGPLHLWRVGENWLTEAEKNCFVKRPDKRRKTSGRKMGSPRRKRKGKCIDPSVCLFIEKPTVTVRSFRFVRQGHVRLLALRMLLHHKNHQVDSAVSPQHPFLILCTHFIHHFISFYSCPILYFSFWLL